MPNEINFWTNTKVRIKEAGAVQVISAISKANPAEVTYVGADPANGALVQLEVNGMTELNNRVFRVANVDTVGNTFELEGVDSTLYDTFVDGNLYPLTTAASMTTVREVDTGGGGYEYEEVHTIHDKEKRRVPTISEAFSMTLECIFRPSDAAHIELDGANTTKTQRAVEIEWPTGNRVLGIFYVGASGIPGGRAHGLVTTSVAFEGQGKPTFYAT
jgi:hypothetical protein